MTEIKRMLAENPDKEIRDVLGGNLLRLVCKVQENADKKARNSQ